MDRVVIFLSTIGLLLVACTNNEAIEKIHPNQQNLPTENDRLTHIVNLEDLNQIKEENPIYQLLSNIGEVDTVGVLYGDEQEMFGFIKDLVVDSNQRIFVLDEKQQEIRVFNDQNEYLQTLGGKGRGPGEFYYARSMSIYDDQWLLVSNGYSIEVYDISQEEIRLQESVQFESNIKSICSVGDKLYVNSMQLLQPNDTIENDNFINMVQVFSLPDFVFLSSIAPSYRSNTPMVIDALSAGELSCNEVSETIVYKFENMQVVHGYSAKNGNLKWKIRLDGFHQAQITETLNEAGRTRLIYSTGELKIFDRLLKSQRLKNEFDILQIDRRIVGEDRYNPESVVLSFMLDTSSGEVTYLGSDFPRIMNISKKEMISVTEDYTILYFSDLK